MDIFSNQKQVALIGMVSSCRNRFKSILRFLHLIIGKFDDDQINIKTVFSETNVCTTFMDDDRSADILCPLSP